MSCSGNNHVEGHVCALCPWRDCALTCLFGRWWQQPLLFSSWVLIDGVALSLGFMRLNYHHYLKCLKLFLFIMLCPCYWLPLDRLFKFTLLLLLWLWGPGAESMQDIFLESEVLLFFLSRFSTHKWPPIWIFAINSSWETVKLWSGVWEGGALVFPSKSD